MIFMYFVLFKIWNFLFCFYFIYFSYLYSRTFDCSPLFRSDRVLMNWVHWSEPLSRAEATRDVNRIPSAASGVLSSWRQHWGHWLPGVACRVVLLDCVEILEILLATVHVEHSTNFAGAYTTHHMCKCASMVSCTRTEIRILTVHWFKLYWYRLQFIQLFVRMTLTHFWSSPHSSCLLKVCIFRTWPNRQSGFVNRFQAIPLENRSSV